MKTIDNAVFVAKFWVKVSEDKSGCWIWTGRTLPFGHGQTTFGGKLQLTHRIAWQLIHGEIPDGKCILHLCDNPACVRPDHLFLGTKSDNNTDRANKGRNAPKSGEMNGRAKLTWDDVRIIRSRYNSGTAKVKDIINEYKIGKSTFWHIIRNETWIE